MGCGNQKIKKKEKQPVGSTQHTNVNKPNGCDDYQYFNFLISIEKVYRMTHPGQLEDTKVRHVDLRDLKSAERRFGFKIPIPHHQAAHDSLAHHLRSLLALNHPFLEKNFGVFKNRDDYILVRDDHEGHTLESYITRSRLHEKDIPRIFESILQGLNHIHMRSLFHGFLDGFQIIYRDVGKNEFPILLGYGLSDFWEKTANLKNEELQCHSPESFKGNLSTSSDIWSIGVLIYRFVTGHWPFGGETLDRIKANIIRGIVNYEDQSWSGVSSDCKQLVRKMLSYRPKDRPSAADCLKSSWFIQRKQALTRKETEILLKKGPKRTYTNKIEQIAFMMIADQEASKNQHDQMMKTFRKLDLDNNGVLSKEEMMKGFLKIMTPEQAQSQVDEIFEQGDFDGQGEIDFYEYLMIFTQSSKVAIKDKIKKIFNQADIDRSGSLTFGEVRQMLVKLNLKDADIEVMMRDFDNDGDGVVNNMNYKKISQEEFINLILKNFDVNEEDKRKSFNSMKIQNNAQTLVSQTNSSCNTTQGTPLCDVKSRSPRSKKTVKIKI